MVADEPHLAAADVDQQANGERQVDVTPELPNLHGHVVVCEREVVNGEPLDERAVAVHYGTWRRDQVYVHANRRLILRERRECCSEQGDRQARTHFINYHADAAARSCVSVARWRRSRRRRTSSMSSAGSATLKSMPSITRC